VRVGEESASDSLESALWVERRIDLGRCEGGYAHGAIMAAAVTICDVGPRDGLQNETTVLEPAVRAELANRLAEAGLPKVEVVSFVSEERVPQMAGPQDVVAGLARHDGVIYAGLVLNEQGHERFAGTQLDELHFTLGATESFNRRNANRSVDESVEELRRINSKVPVSASISVSFGCPFEGEVAAETVLRLAERLVEAGAGEVVFADTIGVGVPRQVSELVSGAEALCVPVGLHFHDTRNTAVANTYAALEAGAHAFESSVGGLGGCPFAPNSTGNVATEDLVYLLHGEGMETGIDLDALIGVARWLEGVLGHPLPGRVHRAGPFAPQPG
jgi:isopropylmalate/homocitrate/citramalate synthase